MGNFVLMPDGNVFLVNGANTGVAGYGNDCVFFIVFFIGEFTDCEWQLGPSDIAMQITLFSNRTFIGQKPLLANDLHLTDSPQVPSLACITVSGFLPPMVRFVIICIF